MEATKMSEGINSWTEFRIKRMAELKQLEENKGKSARDLMPMISQEWKSYKQETEFIQNYPEPEEETKETNSNTDNEEKEESSEEFDYQCADCGYQFNGKKEVCPKCGLKFNWRN